MSIAKAKKGEVVVLLGFTGIRLADMTIASATKTEITIVKSDGKELVFDRKTGIQTNVAEGKEKYANKIVSVEDAPEKKAKKAPAKKKKAPAKKEPVVEVEEEDEDEEPAPVKKKTAKKKAAPVIEDEDEDDDYEEM